MFKISKNQQKREKMNFSNKQIEISILNLMINDFVCFDKLSFFSNGVTEIRDTENMKRFY